MFEHRSEPIISLRRFPARMMMSVGLAAIFVGLSLGKGTVGCRLTEGLSWLDSAVGAAWR